MSAEDGVIDVTDMTPTIAALVAALAKAQGQMGGAKKDAVAEVQYGNGPVRKRAYADLASVWEAIRAPLSANGIAIIQTTETVQGGICVVTLMAHASGEWIRSRLSMPASKNDAQGYGSALTYARRYSLMAIVGIAPEDDDAEEAVRAPRQERQERAPAPPPPTQNIPPKGASAADKEAASAIAHAMREAGMAGDRHAVLLAFAGATERKPAFAASILQRLAQLKEEAIGLCDAAAQKGAAE